MKGRIVKSAAIPAAVRIPGPLAAIGTGWLLCGWYFLSVIPQYRPDLPKALALAPSLQVPVLVLGFCLAMLGLWSSAKAPQAPDIQPRTAWVLLFLVMAAAILLRYAPYPSGLPGFYWDDCATEICDARNSLELGERRWILPYGSRYPLFNYWVAAIWGFFPHVQAFLMQRWASAFMDLLAVGLCYLLGRELGTRRFGVLLAAFAALSKPQIRESLFGCAEITAPLATTLILLAVLRIFKGPTTSRFLLWGFSLAWAAYSYQALWPLILLSIFTLLGWVLWRQRDRKIGPAGILLVSGLSLLVVYLFLTKNQILAAGNPFARYGQVPWVRSAVVTAVLLSFLKTWDQSLRGKGWAVPLFRWALALFLFWVLVRPFIDRPDFGSRVQKLLIVGKGPLSSLPAVLSQKAMFTLDSFFLGRGVGEFKDSVFDLNATCAILLGLAWFIVRPSWRMTLVLGAVAAGIIPHLLGVQSHHHRAMAAVVPFLALAAYGFDRLAGLLQKRWGPRAGGALFLALSAAFFLWEGIADYRGIYLGWTAQEGRDACCARIIRDDASTRRVYVASGSFVSAKTQGVLSEGFPCYFLQTGEATICRRPDETPQDVEILMPASDDELKGRITGQYPRAQWTEFRMQGQPPTEPPFILRAVIPAGDIGEAPGKIFTLRKTGAGEWKREVFWVLFGFGHGVIQWEDCVPSIDAPFPPFDRFVMRLNGRFEAAVPGRYRFTLENGQWADLSVDGRRLIRVRSKGWPRSVSASVKLEPGNHEIRCLMYSGFQKSPPVVSVVRPGGTQKERLGATTEPPS